MIPLDRNLDRSPVVRLPPLRSERRQLMRLIFAAERRQRPLVEVPSRNALPRVPVVFTLKLALELSHMVRQLLCDSRPQIFPLPREKNVVRVTLVALVLALVMMGN